MKTLSTFVLAALAMGSAPAFAQAENFAGFSMTLNAESTNFTMEWIGLDPKTTTTTRPGVQFQYSFAVSDKVVMGAGLTYNGGNDVVGVYPIVGGDIVTRINSRSSIDFIPGYAVSNKVLVYGKLSYVSARGEADIPYGTGYSTGTARGTGYGVGVRTLLNENLYLQAAYDINKYPTFWDSAIGTQIFNMDTKVFSLGVGYKF
jgi:opacity protein-like surface antigen